MNKAFTIVVRIISKRPQHNREFRIPGTVYLTPSFLYSNCVSNRHYTAHGESSWRSVQQRLGQASLAPLLTNRGFTGHEHVDALGIIHMKVVTVKPMLERMTHWNEYLAGNQDEQLTKKIRQHTGTGRPAGEDRFIECFEYVSGRCLKKIKPRRGPATRFSTSMAGPGTWYRTSAPTMAWGGSESPATAMAGSR